MLKLSADRRGGYQRPTSTIPKTAILVAMVHIALTNLLGCSSGSKSGDNFSAGSTCRLPSTNGTAQTNPLPASVFHTATLLPNDTVLIAGGFWDIVAPFSAALYDPTTTRWMETGSLNVFRINHTATLLSNGTVLIAGGFGEGISLNSAELYDPTTSLWSETGSLNMARGNHTATLLPDGTVLVAGGFGGGIPLNSTELYGLTIDHWTERGSLNVSRVNQPPRYYQTVQCWWPVGPRTHLLPMKYSSPQTNLRQSYLGTQ
jgi:hypothetical protein